MKHSHEKQPVELNIFICKGMQVCVCLRSTFKRKLVSELRAKEQSNDSKRWHINGKYNVNGWDFSGGEKAFLIKLKAIKH